MQIAESHGSALDSAQADFVQQGNHLAKIEIDVLTEVRDQAAPLLSGSSKIHGKQPPIQRASISFSSWRVSRTRRWQGHGFLAGFAHVPLAHTVAAAALGQV